MNIERKRKKIVIDLAKFDSSSCLGEEGNFIYLLNVMPRQNMEEFINKYLNGDIDTIDDGSVAPYLSGDGAQYDDDQLLDIVRALDATMMNHGLLKGQGNYGVEVKLIDSSEKSSEKRGTVSPPHTKEVRRVRRRVAHAQSSTPPPSPAKTLLSPPPSASNASHQSTLLVTNKYPEEAIVDAQMSDLRLPAARVRSHGEELRATDELEEYKLGDVKEVFELVKEDALNAIDHIVANINKFESDRNKYGNTLRDKYEVPFLHLFVEKEGLPKDLPLATVIFRVKNQRKAEEYNLPLPVFKLKTELWQLISDDKYELSRLAFMTKATFDGIDFKTSDSSEPKEKLIKEIVKRHKEVLPIDLVMDLLKKKPSTGRKILDELYEKIEDFDWELCKSTYNINSNKLKGLMDYSDFFREDLMRMLYSKMVSAELH